MIFCWWSWQGILLHWFLNYRLAIEYSNTLTMFYILNFFYHLLCRLHGKTVFSWFIIYIQKLHITVALFTQKLHFCFIVYTQKLHFSFIIYIQKLHFPVALFTHRNYISLFHLVRTFEKLHSFKIIYIHKWRSLISLFSSSSKRTLSGIDGRLCGVDVDNRASVNLPPSVLYPSTKLGLNLSSRWK